MTADNQWTGDDLSFCLIELVPSIYNTNSLLRNLCPAFLKQFLIPLTRFVFGRAVAKILQGRPSPYMLYKILVMQTNEKGHERSCL